MGLASLGFGIAACGSNPQTVYMTTSWTRLYHDIPSLKADADLVVSGYVVSGAAAAETPPATDFTFHVTKVLHVRGAAQAAVGPTISIHQTGGVQNGQTYEVTDDPRFKVNEKDILFLHEYAAGRYFVLGGPTGRFQIGPDGMVRPINDEGVTLQATSEDAFEKQVESA